MYFQDREFQVKLKQKMDLEMKQLELTTYKIELEVMKLEKELRLGHKYHREWLLIVLNSFT